MMAGEGEISMSLSLSSSKARRIHKFDWKSSKYNHFVFVFLIQINSQMTTNIQSGPFKFISKIENGVQNTPKSIHWPKQDFIKYVSFINFHKSELDMDEKPNSWSFLRKMSIFIQTKNPNQCRIFHKKMMEGYQSLTELVAYLKNKVQKFDQWFILYEPQLRNLKHCLERETMSNEKQISSVHKQEKNIFNFSGEAQSFDKAKDDLIPTDDAYAEEKQPIPQQYSRGVIKPIKSRQSAFDSFGDIDQSFNNYDELNRTLKQKPIQNELSVTKEDGQKWKQCHMGFLNYFSSLGKLMGGLQQY